MDIVDTDIQRAGCLVELYILGKSSSERDVGRMKSNPVKMQKYNFIMLNIGKCIKKQQPAGTKMPCINNNKLVFRFCLVFLLTRNGNPNNSCFFLCIIHRDRMFKWCKSTSIQPIIHKH